MLSERSDWLKVLPVVGTLSLLAYLTLQALKRKNGLVNLSIAKDDPKVVHGIDIEDLGESKAYCRCWRSKKFPLCDGSHNKHNEETGDNVGPLCFNKK